MSPVSDCVFCAIIRGEAPATIVHDWDDALAIVPLDPVVDGHLLVLPKQHVADFGVDPDVSAAVMRRAAEIVPHPANIITSLGREATQSVWHLHAHIVPRAENDGLALPWYSDRTKRRPQQAGATA